MFLLELIISLAFNSMATSGFTPTSSHWDICIQVDGFYINEYKKEIRKESGILEFGFFYNTFFYADYPRKKRKEKIIYYILKIIIHLN